MEIQQRDNKTLAAYVHQLKTEAKRCDFNSDTATIVSGMHTTSQQRSMKKTPDFISGNQTS